MTATKAFHSSRASGKLSRLIAFSPGYFVFKNENVKVKVKYSFVYLQGKLFCYMTCLELDV
jgi:hypothetical protein